MSAQIRCPHCQRSFDHASQAPDHSLHRPSCVGDEVPSRACTSDELSVVQEEIFRLDATIRQLQTKRSMLLDKVNAIRARTAILPPEILSRIFLFVRPSQPFDTRRYTMRVKPRALVLQLAAVCSAWRQVAFSTPELWTTLYMTIRNSASRVDATILQTFFENAGALSIALRLNFDLCRRCDVGPRERVRGLRARFLGSDDTVSERNPRPIPSEHVLKTLLSNAKKIRVLQIDHMPRNWVVGNHWERFTNLQDLRLSNCKYDKVHIPNSTRKLVLEEVNFDDTIILPSSASNITDLEIHAAPINVSITLLMECPNLVRCRSTAPRDGDGSPRLGIKTSMQHLEVLDWETEYDSSIWHCTFLQQFRFPALRELRWRELEPQEGERALSAYFFEQLPVTLQKLELVFAGRLFSNPAISLLATAPWAPHLPELVLDMQPPWDDHRHHLEVSKHNARAVLNMLGGGKLIPSGGQTPLPTLKKLCLRMNFPSSRSSEDADPRMDADQLVRMLTMRGELGLTDFQLFWDGDLDNCVDGSGIEKLQELVRKGLHLRIVDTEGPFFPWKPNELDDEDLSHVDKHGSDHPWLNYFSDDSFESLCIFESFE